MQHRGRDVLASCPKILLGVTTELALPGGGRFVESADYEKPTFERPKYFGGEGLFLVVGASQ